MVLHLPAQMYEKNSLDDLNVLKKTWVFFFGPDPHPPLAFVAYFISGLKAFLFLYKQSVPDINYK